MAKEDLSKPSFSAGRRFATGLNAFVGLAAVLAIAVMLNYLAARHYVRRELNSVRRTQLSTQTARVLQSLTNEVRVTVFFDARDQEELHSLTTKLLREYTYLTPHLLFKVIDPTREPAKAELLLARYKLTSLKNKNFVIFDCAGRTKVVYENELSDYDVNAVVSGKSQEFRRTAFRGEMLFTTAIFNLANPRQFKVCFLDGHGEHDPDKADAEQLHGYGKFAAILHEEVNAAWGKISLLGTNEIPADCQLLVIAGARLPFDDAELEKISQFMKQGGRLFALLGNMGYSSGRKSGLEKLLAQSGIIVSDSMVFDPKFQLTSAGDLLTAQLNPGHPVTKALLADSDDLRIRLVLPRALTNAAVAGPDAPKIEVLAAGSEEAVEASEIRDGVPYRNQYTDRQGAFPLILAAEQGNVKGVTTERGAMRLIVAGDSLAFDNQMIDTAPGNHAFAALAVNWLLDRPPILLQGLLPRPLKEYHVVMSHREQQIADVILLAGMPAVVLLFGGLVWWRRRK